MQQVTYAQFDDTTQINQHIFEIHDFRTQYFVYTLFSNDSRFLNKNIEIKKKRKYIVANSRVNIPYDC